MTNNTHYEPTHTHTQICTSGWATSHLRMRRALLPTALWSWMTLSVADPSSIVKSKVRAFLCASFLSVVKRPRTTHIIESSVKRSIPIPCNAMQCNTM